jgi:4-carboxymuconolactone decarboxylase
MSDVEQDPFANPGKRVFGSYAPEFVALTDEVMYGDVWERPGLSHRDRSLITVASLLSLVRTDQLGHHLERALNNGVTEQELIDAITHLAFYAGWPAAVTAMSCLQEISER